MKKIYILNSCDIWKSHNSMSLIAAAASLNKIKNIIVQKIKSGDIEYKRGCNDLPIKEQIKMFKKDWNENDKGFAFANLEYGYVKEVIDGEIV